MKLDHDGKVKIAVGRSRFDTDWKTESLTWFDLLIRLSETATTKESFTKYQKMEKKHRDAIKDIGGFLGTTLKSGHRTQDQVDTTYILTFDADNARASLKDEFDLLYGHACAAYTTHSHSPDQPRYRFLIPLSKGISPEAGCFLKRIIAKDLGMEQFDPVSFKTNQLMYWPSTSKGGEYKFEYSDAPWLDPGEMLKAYPNWKDAAAWPTHPGESKAPHKGNEKAEDPREKPGIVGAFCRTYDIPAAIEKYLAEVYTPCTGGDRYTYANGSTAAGLHILDDGQKAQSYHATDPAYGQHNAYDLVRIHLFGDNDPPGVDFDNLPSQKAMQEFAGADPEVLELQAAEKLAEAQKDFIKAPRLVFFDENGKKFIAKYLGDWFRDRHPCIKLKGELYVYQEGFYRPGKEYFFQEATNALGKEFTRSRVMEAFNYLENTSRIFSPEEASSGNWLCLKNGILNINTRELKPHTPELLSIIQLPVIYDPEARCPSFEKFIELVAPGSLRTVSEIIGYCLAPTMRFEKAIVLTGGGGNGKGTLLSVIGHLLGEENVSHNSLQNLSENRFLAAELHGKLANIHADIPNKMIENTDLFKTLTSGDPITAERKFGQPFSFRNRAKLLFSANERPNSKDNSEGFHRRWLCIPFTIKFTDRELRTKLFSDEEMSGLLNLALDGLERLNHQGGFTGMASAEEEAEAYRRKSDSAYGFLKERYEATHDGQKLSKQDLYNEYRTFCGNGGCYAVSQANFNAKVKSVLGAKENRSSGVREWVGIKLQDDCRPLNDF